jgi:hypothetical protein
VPLLNGHVQAEQVALRLFNPRFALWRSAGTDSILIKVRPGVELYKVASFKSRYSLLKVGVQRDETTSFVELAKLWLTLPGAHRVEHITFKPNAGVSADPREWNMADDFVTPVGNEPPPYFARVVNECFAPDDREWLLDWLAHLVQDPLHPCGTAVGIVGKSNCGKSRLGAYFGRVLGRMLYHPLTSAGNLTSKFNADSEGSLLLHVDEGAAEDLEQRLPDFKAAVTSETRRIERKNFDSFRVPNLIRILLTGEVVPVTVRDGGSRKRGALFEMLPVFVIDDHTSQERRVELRAFWEGFTAEMNGDGPARLLGFLLARQIRHDLRIAPRTAARQTATKEQLNGLPAWICQSIEDGLIAEPPRNMPAGDDEGSHWQVIHPMQWTDAGVFPIAELHRALVEWWKKHEKGLPPRRETMVAQLKKIGAMHHGRRRSDGGGPQSYWEMPDPKSAEVAAAVAKEWGVELALSAPPEPTKKPAPKAPINARTGKRLY